MMRGDVAVFHYHDVADLDPNRDLLVDVRSKEELCRAIAGAVHIPLEELRDRLDELPQDRRIYLFCRVGRRSYIAARILEQNGFTEVFSLSGGYELYHSVVLDQTAENACLSKEEQQ